MSKTITSITLGALVFGLCLSAEAQQARKIPRIGFLSGGSASSELPLREALRQGLRDLGYVHGQNVSIEERFGAPEQFPDLAAELVSLKVDLIVVTGGATALAAKNATKSIPIVMAVVGDPVGTGIVASLRKPGGNVTGFSIMSPELSGKRLELLKEIVPGNSRVAVFASANAPSRTLMIKETREAARPLRLQLLIIEVRQGDFESAFQTATKGHAGAVNVLPAANFVSRRKKLVDLAAKNRLPAIYDDRQITESGGLMSYGPDRSDLYRRTAIYVDKILKGTKPADLPVEQPRKFEFVVNLQAAKQIGLTIPPNVLARADKVIR
jgi:putative ABC transport system substrate-binding protein